MYAPESISDVALCGQGADACAPLPLSLAEANLDEEFDNLAAGEFPAVEDAFAANQSVTKESFSKLNKETSDIEVAAGKNESQSSSAGEEIEANCLSAAQEEEKKLKTFLAAAEKHRSRLLWLAQRITNSREEAEDVVQHALLKAFVNLAKFRGDSQMSTWLGAIVQNTAREHMRSQRGKVMLSLEYAPDEDGESAVHEIPDPAKTPEEHYEFQERQDIVRSAMNRMTESHRRALQLCVMQDVPYVHAARKLNVTLSSMKSRVFRGKQLLKVAVARQLSHAG